MKTARYLSFLKRIWNVPAGFIEVTRIKFYRHGFIRLYVFCLSAFYIEVNSK